MFFDSWTSLLRIIIVGFLGYCGLVALLRVSGNRTLAKLNAFDFVVTVALGSVLATALLDEKVPLANGLLAFTTLIGLQAVLTRLTLKFRPFEHWIKNEPSLLFHNGQFHEDAMRQVRISHEEILQGLRSQGYSGLGNVVAIVLETNGSLSIVRQGADSSAVREILNG